ncbi:MAG TPA: serine/threonine protein kinase [Blastocatellia bacterium]|nr:serine/threonine protein kinase [Blastocatellia bacterium]
MWLQFIPDALLGKSETQAKLVYASQNQDELGEPVLKAWELMDGSFFRLRYSDGTEFVIDREGAQIWCTWPDNLTIEDTTVYLLGPIFGFVLRLRGTLCLHASAIAVGEYAIAIVGPAGTGKSTTAAALAKSGFPVLTDDVLALTDMDGIFMAQPAYPHLRLWPASVNILYGKPDALPRLVPGDSLWDKRYLNLTENDYMFQRHPLPLASIYLLSERTEDSAAPFIESMSASAGLMTLVTNTYANHLLNTSRRAQEFGLLSRIASSLPVRRVIPHASPFFLSKLCEVIINDFHQQVESNRMSTAEEAQL